MDANSVVACELDRAQHQHLRPGCGQLQHLLVREGVQLARLGDETRVGGEDALDVGVDLQTSASSAAASATAVVSARRGRASSPPAQSRRPGSRRRPRPLRERLVDALRPDLEHLRARVRCR